METVLRDLYERKITPEKAKRLLEDGYLDIGGIGKFDLFRSARCGVPEVVIAEGKHYPHLLRIVKEALSHNGQVLVSRLDKVGRDRLEKDLGTGPGGKRPAFEISIYSEANGLSARRKGHKIKPTGGSVGLITAGTSDIPVALEADMVLTESGIRTIQAFDVGVAGIHRLAPVIKRMRAAKVDAYIVCAGREGTLPALVAGLVDALVIGVPISTGYGMGGKGEAALYSMLQSCAPIAVVNIDAGLVAGLIAVQISNRISNIHRKNRRTGRGPSA